MAKDTEINEIKKFMQLLGITEEEAIELIEFDKDVLGNKEVEELTKKAKSVSKEMRQVAREPKEEKPKMAGVTTQTRKRKDDFIKQQIIQTINKSLAEIPNITNLEVVNIEKTILFTLQNANFEIDLKKKRK